MRDAYDVTKIKNLTLAPPGWRHAHCGGSKDDPERVYEAPVVYFAVVRVMEMAGEETYNAGDVLGDRTEIQPVELVDGHWLEPCDDGFGLLAPGEEATQEMRDTARKNYEEYEATVAKHEAKLAEKRAAQG